MQSIVKQIGSVDRTMGLAVGVSVGIGIASMLWLQNRSKPSDILEETTTELLDLESTNLMLMVPSITTVTFYEGSVLDQLKYLEKRIHGMVAQNPWLEGRLVKPGNIVHLKHKQFQGQLKPLTYLQVSDPLLDESMEYEALNGRVSHFVVKAGNEVIGKHDEALFRVTLINISDKKFALVFSISHVIADGHTFYSLYSMLCSSLQPRPLTIQRYLPYRQRLESAMKGNDTYTWVFSLGTTLNIIKTLLCLRKPVVLKQKIDLQWIELEKTNYQQQQQQPSNTSTTHSPPFISTNDILSSWYFNSFQCNIGILAMNFRNRFTELTNDLAGNYEALIAYQPKDFQTPALIRRSLPLYHRLHLEEALPSFWSSLTSRVAILSTWVTFYHEIQLINARHLYHMPYFLNKDVAFHDISILFCPRKNEIELISMSRTYSTAKELEAALRMNKGK